MEVGEISHAPDYGSWRNVAFGGRAPGPMEVDPRSIAVGTPYRKTEGAGSPRQPLTAANDNHRQTPAHWPKVVAFTGLAGSGKSTAADYLVSLGYQRVKFAGPLKAMMRAMGLSEDHIEGPLKELPTPLLAGKTPRYAMQTIGTDWGRDMIGPTLWTGLWHATVSDVLDYGGRVVCDDCRFPNEVEVVRGVGGRVLKLHGRGGIAGAHASEQQEFKVDGVIYNFWEKDRLPKEVALALDLIA